MPWITIGCTQSDIEMHTNPITIPPVQYNPQCQEHKHGTPLLDSVSCVINKLDVADPQGKDAIWKAAIDNTSMLYKIEVKETSSVNEKTNKKIHGHWCKDDFMLCQPGAMKHTHALLIKNYQNGGIQIFLQFDFTVHQPGTINIDISLVLRLFYAY